MEATFLVTRQGRINMATVKSITANGQLLQLNIVDGTTIELELPESLRLTQMMPKLVWEDVTKDKPAPNAGTVKLSGF